MKLKSIIIIVLLVAAVNFKLLKAPFLYDDRDIIIDNKKLHNINNITKIFSKDYYSITQEISFRPMVSIFHFVNYYFWDNKPLGFRIMELLIYIIVCLMVYILGWKLFNNQSVALVASIFFAAHPVHSETLGCITLAYGELLYCLFFLLAFLFYLKTVENFNTDNILVTYLFWILALLSKEIAIVFPVFVFTHLVGIKKSKKLFYLFGGYIFIAIIYLVIRFSIFSFSELKYLSYIGGSFYTNILTMSNVFLQYIWLLIFPLKLAVEYPPIVITTIADFRVIFAITLVSILIIFFIYLIKIKKWNLLIACVLIILPLLPAMNLIPFMKDSLLNVRYLLLPSVGFCWLLGVLFTNFSRRHLNAVYHAGLVAIIILLSIRTIVRNYDWANEIRLWQKNVEMFPDFFKSHLSLGGAFYYNGLLNEALKEYQQVKYLDPGNPYPYYNTGYIYEKKGDIKNAIEEYKKAYETVKNYPQDAPRILPVVKNVYLSLARICEKQSNEKEALFFYKLSGEENTYLLNKLNREAVKHIKKDSYDSAIDKLLQALEIDPNFTVALCNLAYVYNKKKMFNEVILYAEKTFRVDPEFYQAYFNLADTYREVGDSQSAIRYYEKGLRGQPENTAALFQLAKLYLAQKKYRKAILHFSKVIALQPNNTDTYNYLAICYMNTNKFYKAKETIELALKISPNDEILNNNYKKIKDIIEKKGDDIIKIK